MVIRRNGSCVTQDATNPAGLFDLNAATHTSPSWILNLGAGYTVHQTGGATFSRPCDEMQGTRLKSSAI